MIPGLVDVHIHGAKGHDFCDANTNGPSDIAAYLYSCGVTSFCATSMTLPENQLMEIFETVSGVPDDGNHAYVAGIHMEGPFLSPTKKGAQKEVTSATLVWTHLPLVRSFQWQNKVNHHRSGTSGSRQIY